MLERVAKLSPFGETAVWALVGETVVPQEPWTEETLVAPRTPKYGVVRTGEHKQGEPRPGHSRLIVRESWKRSDEQQNYASREDRPNQPVSEPQSAPVGCIPFGFFPQRCAPSVQRSNA